MPKKRPSLTYNSTLRPEDQIDMEEQIAAMIFVTDCDIDEEECADLGRAILRRVLKKFRPDLLN